MQSLLKYPFHLFLFPLFFILVVFTNNLDELNFSDLILPVSISFISVSIVFVILLLISKNYQKNSLYLSFTIILFFSYGHLFFIMDNIQIDFLDLNKHRYLLTGFTIIFFTGIILILKKSTPKTFTPITNTVSIVLITVILTNIPYSELSDFSENSLPTLSSDLFNSDLETSPDIYYIVLDEYAGSRTLQNYFDFDNSQFTSFLQNNGFYVSSNSNSNYLVTALAVPSVMQMNYLHLLTSSNSPNSFSITSESYQENNVMKFFNEHGYTTVHIYGGILQKINSADYNLCSDLAVTDFHTMLIQTTILWPIQKYQFIYDLNEIRLCSLTELSSAYKKFDEPMFVFAHIKLPHDPFTLDSNGENIIPKKIDLGITSGGDKAGYLNQLKFTNSKIIEIIPQIISNSKSPPVIIIQSDHGIRFELNSITSENTSISESDAEIIQRSFNNFNAVYFPDGDYSLMYDDFTPVNTFRIIFNKYFNSELDILDDMMFMSFGTKQPDLYDVSSLVDFPPFP